MEIFENIVAALLTVIGSVFLLAFLLLLIYGLVLFCRKIVPLLYRSLVAETKIIERKVDKIDDDDKTITII